MPQKPLSTDLAQQALDAYELAGRNAYAAAETLNMKTTTFDNRLRVARRMDLKPSEHVRNPQTDTNLLHDEIRKLKAQIDSARKATLDDEYVKRKILGLATAQPSIPQWLVKMPKGKKNSGVPTLFASDWHWGEIVDPNQIGGVNEYDLAIAQERARVMVEVAIDLVRNHLSISDCPGIVFALGGDMVSGDIHEELIATNEKEIMPTVLDLWGVLVWCIDTLANEFGRVFVPCVTGNHGRNTHKIRAKGRNYTSFDWLLYQFLAKRFENDKRVQFLIPDGPDAVYSIYGHRYCLTHGDQFRGGDGMIGALGPIIRGDHKKRSRNAQIDKEYDTLLLGHWHQLVQLQRLIVNGSLKGYDEYANQNNFGYEPPRQAMWITSPTHGITFSAPVLVDRRPTVGASEWIGWK